MKILVIDDSKLDRLKIISDLNKYGITNAFLEASNGEEGMELLVHHHQDIKLILLDWQMPKVDGVEFMRAIRSVPDYTKIPIVMITASGSPEAKMSAQRVNPNLAGYLVKPYKIDQLIKAVSPYLDEIHP